MTGADLETILQFADGSTHYQVGARPPVGAVGKTLRVTPFLAVCLCLWCCLDHRRGSLTSFRPFVGCLQGTPWQAAVGHSPRSSAQVGHLEDTGRKPRVSTPKISRHLA